jgi:hypothetical protein
MKAGEARWTFRPEASHRHELSNSADAFVFALAGIGEPLPAAALMNSRRAWVAAAPAVPENRLDELLGEAGDAELFATPAKYAVTIADARLSAHLLNSGRQSLAAAVSVSMNVMGDLFE